MNDKYLSKNFRLSELIRSSTANRKGIDNWPKEESVIESLQKVATNILQPVRDHYGIAFRPNSGFRCLELNREIKSKDSSQHIKGEAVDFEIAGIPNVELARWCRDNLDFDQLIFEFGIASMPTAGWVHCSYVSANKNRKQVLTINREKGSPFIGIHDNTKVDQQQIEARIEVYVDESVLINHLCAYKSYSYDREHPNYPTSIPGISLPQAPPNTTNCCCFVEGLLVSSWVSTHKKFKWSKKKHAQMMINVSDLFAPVTAIIESGMGSRVQELKKLPEPWTIIQGWRDRVLGSSYYYAQESSIISQNEN